MKELSKKQKAFCDAYLTNGFNAYQAAISAGYTTNYANQATKFLLGNIRIQEYLSKRTSKIEKEIDGEVDKILSKIYLIGSGQRIIRRYKTLGGLPGKFVKHEKIEGPASFKDQISAAELWLKAKGEFRNENVEIEKAKQRKLNAEAKLAESKVEDNDKKLPEIIIHDSWGRSDGK